MRLWSVTVEYWNRVDEDWEPAFSLERGRFLFDSIEAAKTAGAAFANGELTWCEEPDGDWGCQLDAATRLSAHWVEGDAMGGRGRP